MYYFILLIGCRLETFWYNQKTPKMNTIVISWFEGSVIDKNILS